MRHYQQRIARGELPIHRGHVLGPGVDRPHLDAGHAGQVVGYAIIGLGACAYSPAKYGILPEIVPNAFLVKANGAVEMLTLVAIIAGLYGGAALYDHFLSLDACYGASAALYALATQL